MTPTLLSTRSIGRCFASLADFHLSIVLLVALFGFAWCEAQAQSVEHGPLYCLLANETCYGDTTCYPLLSSIPRWCGNYTAGRCMWVKEQHCLSILRTLKNRLPFKDCHCRQEQFDHAGLQRCRQMHKFVQNHPCLERAMQQIRNQSQADSDSDLPAVSVSVSSATDNATCEELFGEQPSCLAARKQCAAQQVCSAFLEQFRTACKVRGGKCAAVHQEAVRCSEAFRELSRHAPALFMCHCAEPLPAADERRRRCDKLQLSFRWNPCVQQAVPKCALRVPVTPAPAQLAWLSSSTRSSEPVLESQSPSDCFDVVSDCHGNETCRAALGNLVQACKFYVTPRPAVLHTAAPFAFFERCELPQCSAAVYEFYSIVPRRLAHSAAFCTCPHPDSPDYANCIKHLEYLRPSCMFAQQPAPNCFEMLHGCYARSVPVCRDTMKIFNADCKPAANRNSNDSCANGVSKCRQAILRMIPNGLILDTCTCDGMYNSSARNLCIEIQRKLYNNSCVAEALSVPQAARVGGRFGFGVGVGVDARRGLSRPVLSQLPTGFNESTLSSDVCLRLPRFSKVTSSYFRLYERYGFGAGASASADGGCTELVRCEEPVPRQANDLWCDDEVKRFSSSLALAEHVAFLQPLAALCANSSTLTSFTVYSSVSQYCVCHYAEVVCSTVAPDTVRNAHAQDSAVLLHVGYSNTELELLNNRFGDEMDVDNVADKLALLLNDMGRRCSLRAVWDEPGHILFDVRPANELDYDDSHCANASKLLAHFVNQRHPFVTHELDLSVLRSAVVQASDDPLFASDFSAFKRFLPRLNEQPIVDDDDDTYDPPDQSVSVQQLSSSNRDRDTRRDLPSVRALAPSLVHSAALLLLCLFSFVHFTAY